VAVALVTGSAGLIGSQAARRFASLGLDVVGVDNDMRRYFFGDDGSTAWVADALKRELGARYTHYYTDIRDRTGLEAIFTRYGRHITVIIHAAAQPSHDWAVKEPFTDFDVNAVGTLNLLEYTRRHCPASAFIFCSTNKVYGDQPNRLPLVEQDTRWEIAANHPYANGIGEDMSIDHCLHSIFGVGKVASDAMVQEYGHYFDMNTVAFRCGTLTGPAHAAAELHGFLAYLMRCAMQRRRYTIYGYGGKQVRDAIHSHDLVSAFEAYFHHPRPGEVYNMGGGRHANCSIREAMTLAEQITGQPMNTTYTAANRIGDHMWWISGLHRFQHDYPGWKLTYDIPAILTEIHDANTDRWTPAG
jgi:CDP-paratose 2-epimerase